MIFLTTSLSSISRLKNKALLLCFAIFQQVLRAKVVFPIPGLAAKIIKFPFLNPPILLSKSLNPVLTPMCFDLSVSNTSSKTSFNMSCINLGSPLVIAESINMDCTSFKLSDTFSPFNKILSILCALLEISRICLVSLRICT